LEKNAASVSTAKASGSLSMQPLTSIPNLRWPCRTSSMVQLFSTFTCLLCTCLVYLPWRWRHRNSLKIQRTFIAVCVVLHRRRQQTSLYAMFTNYNSTSFSYIIWKILSLFLPYAGLNLRQVSGLLSRLRLRLRVTFSFSFSDKVLYAFLIGHTYTNCVTTLIPYFIKICNTLRNLEYSLISDYWRNSFFNISSSSLFSM